MKKINKQSLVPESLNNNLTNKKRNEIIKIGMYPSNATISKFAAENVKTYNAGYKQDDIIAELKKLYKGKCVYCESKNRQLSVEHYRPKSVYYWLAYSWDNLLYSCPICNSRKSNKFPIKKEKTQYNKDDISTIHHLQSKYDKLEEPLLINPESKDVNNDIVYSTDEKFDTDKISNEKLLETIKLLNLNDDDLSESRKAIYDKLEKAITEKIYEIKQSYDIERNKNRIEQIIEDFINDIDIEFHTFRRYIVKHWIKDIIGT